LSFAKKAARHGLSHGMGRELRKHVVILELEIAGLEQA
jgi:hypothetical protein